MNLEMDVSPREPTDFCKKIGEIKKIFSEAKTPPDKYSLLIRLGEALPKMSPELRIDKNLVSGCQSLTFVHATVKNGKIFFEAFSEALISRGLAALLIQAYQGVSLEVLLRHPPQFLQEIGLHTALSMNRSQGAYNIYLKMCQLGVHQNGPAGCYGS